MYLSLACFVYYYNITNFIYEYSKEKMDYSYMCTFLYFILYWDYHIFY